MSTKTVEQLNIIRRSALNNREEILLNEFNLLLTKNIEYSRSVKYYADLLAISAKKLNNTTKAYCGKTAKEFIEEKVIIYSKKMLLDSADTVKKISYNLGFTEPTNFNKFFKKFTTITPLQYREQHNRGAF